MKHLKNCVLLNENVDMSEESMALDAARMYSEDATFQHIADKLEVSKSHAQVLVRKGLALSLKEMENPGEPPQVNPGEHPVLEEMPPSSSFAYPQTPRNPESFMLETTGIPRRIVLTPKCLMIYDLWCGSGYEGDLSDFLEDSVNYLYQSKRPTERL